VFTADVVWSNERPNEKSLTALVAKRDNMVKDELEPEEKVKWNYLT